MKINCCIKKAGHSAPPFLSKLEFEVGLLRDGSYDASANSTATFANSEACTFFQSDWSDELNIHGDVVARHNHFGAFWKSNYSSNVGRTEVELWTVTLEEWS